ncbi:MAG: hypothetical protein ACRC0R_05105 [Cetobacterium sp.]
MRMLLKDGQYHEVMIDSMTEKLAVEIINNKVKMLGEDYNGSDLDAYSIKEFYEADNYSIVLNGEFAGFIILEDADTSSGYDEDGDEIEGTKDVNIVCGIGPRFRGLNLIGKVTDILCILEGVDVAYWIADMDNISSIKSCKGFSICSNQEIHFSDLDKSAHIKFVKYYNVY